MNYLKICSSCFFSLFTIGIAGQNGLNPDSDYCDLPVIAREALFVNVETAGTYTKGDYAPFWITSNNYGVGSERPKNGYVRTGLFGTKRLFDDKLDVSFGADVLAGRNLTSTSSVYFQQLYADFRYKILGLSIGAKERSAPFRNEDLSTGGLTLSRNSRPIPQVEAGFPEFVQAPYTNNWMQVQGGVSYGWFTDSKYKKRFAGDGFYSEGELYHRKYAYFKFEKNTPWYFVFGAEMDTQWGGKFYDKRYPWNGYKYSSPTGLWDFFRVFIPMAGGDGANGTDIVNIQGEVHGSWHFIFNYKKGDYSIRPYYEHFFDDHSGMWLKNMPDGIYGLELNLNKKRPVSSVVLEYIHTKDQSGPFLWDENQNIPVQVSAGDDYYNHVDYVSYAYYGLVLGNPLLTSPVYNNGRTLQVLNNRISAFHGGLSGYLADNLQYRALLTYSRSWGAVELPARKIRT
ncbi:MAG: capsule assembly Wzi family protein, partial [Prevotella sp.]|nr:capsule assembly Wzi family protein [Prevotella sp.]